jgi:hypothetical protein
MSNDDIIELTNEIKRLKIVLEALEVSITNHTNASTRTPTATAIASPVDSGNRRDTNNRGAFFLNRTTNFQIGDRIAITNKVKSPQPGRAVNANDKIRTVLKVSARRIDIISANGHKTWRAPNNLRIRTQYE